MLILVFSTFSVWAIASAVWYPRGPLPVSHITSLTQSIIAIAMLKYHRNLNSTVSQFELIPPSTDVGQGSMTDDSLYDDGPIHNIVSLIVVLSSPYLSTSIAIFLSSSLPPCLSTPSQQLDIIPPWMDALTHIWMRAFAAADVALSLLLLLHAQADDGMNLLHWHLNKRLK